MRRVLILAFVIFGLVRPLEALTIRDLIELSRAGLGEEVLLALIEVDGGVYAIDTATLKSLKEAGISDRVIAALVRSGRERPAEPPSMATITEPQPPEPQPQVVVIDHHDQPEVREVAVPVPVYVHVPARRSRFSHVNRTPESTYVPFQFGPPATRPVVEEPRTQYWGFGGKLRPDAWGQPKPERDQRDKDQDNDNDKEKEKDPKAKR